MENTVAIAAIGLAGTLTVGLIWVVKFVLNKLNSTMQEHVKAAVEQAAESKASRETSEEVLKFMKNLNGKLEGAFVAKVKEKSVIRGN